MYYTLFFRLKKNTYTRNPPWTVLLFGTYTEFYPLWRTILIRYWFYSSSTIPRTIKIWSIEFSYLSRLPLTMFSDISRLMTRISRYAKSLSLMEIATFLCFSSVMLCVSSRTPSRSSMARLLFASTFSEMVLSAVLGDDCTTGSDITLRIQDI